MLGWGAALVTTLIFVYIIYGMFSSHSTWFAGFGIALINTVLPDIMTVYTNFECHLTVVRPASLAIDLASTRHSTL